MFAMVPTYPPAALSFILYMIPVGVVTQAQLSGSDGSRGGWRRPGRREGGGQGTMAMWTEEWGWLSQKDEHRAQEFYH
jgi:hypothetical protein